MEKVRELQAEVESLKNEIESFLEKPNKAKSKRIRMALTQLKKFATEYKRVLIDLDKQGY
jgi:outer membrane murein-binding lipoprotein Lpp